jgi:hypothetical protein
MAFLEEADAVEALEAYFPEEPPMSVRLRWYLKGPTGCRALCHPPPETF